MFLVNTPARSEDTIKKSRFIGYIIPCDGPDAIIDALTGISRKHPNASHVAFAYRVHTPDGIRIQFSDAGEPAGTAGKPILNHLQGSDLINCLIAVVRYFGGVKLGAGGLTRAYGQAARKVIEHSVLSPYVEFETVHLKIGYSRLRQLEYRLAQLEGTIVNKEFSESVDLLIRVPQHQVQTLIQEFSPAEPG